MTDNRQIHDVNGLTSVPEQKRAQVRFPNVDLPRIDALSEPIPATDPIQAYRQSAQLWLQHAPRFKLNVDLEKLKARPRNSAKDKAQAAQKVKEMLNWPSDPFSGLWYDIQGKLMVAVFASRIRPTELEASGTDQMLEYRTGLLGCRSRMLEDLRAVPPELLCRDGFPAEALPRFHEATQILHAHLHPISRPRDGRHNVLERVIDLVSGDAASSEAELIASRASLITGLDPSQGDLVCYPGKTKSFERVGVSHLVHAWEQQGHPGDFSPSQDFLRTAQSAQACRYYMRGTKTMVEQLAEMFQAAFPDYYNKYRDAFEAGVWERDDPGPWLGRAIVWKMQVLPHRDGLDDGPTATFPLGYYEGGEMYFTDLKLKLSYLPGDVIIAMAGFLYHAVGEWKPVPSNTSLSPGRVSHVLFFPRKSFELLEGKAPDWGNDTMLGKLPHVWGGVV